MITPNDIATKDFKKVAVGYSPEEVDTFLDDIYEDYEKLYKESQKEKSKTEAVAEDTDRLKHLEKSIERTCCGGNKGGGKSRCRCHHQQCEAAGRGYSGIRKNKGV